MEPVTVLAAPQNVSFMIGIQSQIYDEEDNLIRVLRPGCLRTEETGDARSPERMAGQRSAGRSRRPGLGSRREDLCLQTGKETEVVRGRGEESTRRCVPRADGPSDDSSSHRRPLSTGKQKG